MRLGGRPEGQWVNRWDLPHHLEVLKRRYDIMHGKGSQKNARLERLKDEILAYVETNPNCTAADIVDHLANVRRMRNHGLTARKVGYFIPRYLKEAVAFTLDATTGKRLYRVAA